MKDFEIRCDESRLETTNLIYGKFTLGPFLPGQATTFGNALRRSLLAELSGLAITAFEIIGVMQEFSTLPGLRESILDLSLNLKQIVLTGVLPHSTPPIGFLNVRGPAIIKASDLKLPAGVYCASPNQYIATLGSNGMLHLKFVVSVGKGYSIQPYSIYRSLSKIRLQPASNFDNTALGVKEKRGINYARQISYPDPRLAGDPASASITSEACTARQTFQRDMNVGSLVKGNPYNYKSKIANSLSKDIGQGYKSFPFMKNQEKQLEGNNKNVNSLSRNSCEAERLYGQSKEGSQPVVEGKMNTGIVQQGKPLQNEMNLQYLPSACNAKRGLKSEMNVIPPGHTPLGLAEQKKQKERGSKEELLYPRFVKGSDAALHGSGYTPNGLAEQKKQDPLYGLTKQRGQEQALSGKTSQSTFFTNEKNCNSSYINIQTQLFQRITPHQVLPIDAVFTPVSQVNFLTEVNDRFETARENIVLEIWTNGSIHPKRALEEATLSLVQNFDTLLKKIQQASSFYKGLRYWTYLQPFKSSLGEKANNTGLSINSLYQPALQAPHSFYPRRLVQQGKPQQSSHLQSTEEACLIGEPVVGKAEESKKKELLEKVFKKDLPQSIYNLDLGNLNLSLQTFIFLKKAKIHTLLQLLTQFSLKENTISHSLPQEGEMNVAPLANFLNEKIVEEVKDVIRQFGSEE